MRATSIDDILKKKFDEMPFSAEWAASFGMPEKSGVWIAWGNPGNGKTSFALQLAKYLCSLNYRVAYNSMEEGVSRAFQMAIKMEGMAQVRGKFIIINETTQELLERLKKRKSPDIIIIDSLQHAEVTKFGYKDLKKEITKLNKLLIFISHAEGKQPEGRVAKFARYDADVKIHIEGYKANIMSRYGGGEPYIIWQEGADNFHIDNL